MLSKCSFVVGLESFFRGAGIPPKLGVSQSYPHIVTWWKPVRLPDVQIVQPVGKQYVADTML